MKEEEEKGVETKGNAQNRKNKGREMEKEKKLVVYSRGSTSS